MDISTEVKVLYTKEKKTQGQLSKMLGMTQANLSKKIKNNSFFVRDLENIADALGYELKIEFIKKEPRN